MTQQSRPRGRRRPARQWPDRWTYPRSFFGTPICEDLDELDAQVAFLGVPFDQGTTNRPGARFGPNGVRDTMVYRYVNVAGEGGAAVAPGYFDIDTVTTLLEGVTMADCGDVNVAPSNVDLGFERLTRSLESILDRGAFPVIVGGDHAVTFPAVRAFQRYDPLDIVHFDAHLDFTHAYQGEVMYAHGSPIRRCSELSFVRNITSIGLRVVRKDPYEDALQRGVQMISAGRFRELGPEGVVEIVPEARNLYVTVDIDVLDPMQAPGTGTPAVGGLFYEELRDALRLLPSRGRIVGLDVVEVAPMYDHAETTTRVAAQLILDLLGVLFPGASANQA